MNFTNGKGFDHVSKPFFMCMYMGIVGISARERRANIMTADSAALKARLAAAWTIPKCINLARDPACANRTKRGGYPPPVPGKTNKRLAPGQLSHVKEKDKLRGFAVFFKGLVQDHQIGRIRERRRCRCAAGGWYA